MKFLGNIIWLLFGGLFLALGYLFTGLGLCLTIIGIPFGIQVFKLAGLALWPFGKEVRYKKQTTGCLNTGMNLLWILIGGIWLALGHAITGLVYCITIIGIPFGKQHFKLAAIILTPFGREVVSSNIVKKEQAAIEEPAIPALEETPVIENAPEPLAEAAEPQVKESLLQESDKPTEEQTLAIEQQVEEPMSTLPMEEESSISSPANEEKDVVDEDVNLSEKEEDNKKKYYIVGGVLLAALVAGGAFLLFSKSSFKVTDYAVSMNAEGEYTFYANTSGEAIPTGITAYGLSATILDQHDYDDDGNIEALVLVNGGGNIHEPYPFVIYYDQDTKTFKQTEEFEMSDGTVEEIDGQWVFIQRKGLRQTNYIFENHEVKVAEETVQSFGLADRNYLLSVMYNNDEEGDKAIVYDLDDDGKDERLLVHRGFSHAEGYGEYMSLEEIKWESGKTLKSVVIRNDYPVWNYTIYGAEIAFLQSKTNGMHDILTDDIHYHRWNGSTYKEWEWNGTQFVCSDTSEGQYEEMTTWDGEHYLTGVINGQWHFDMWISIDGTHVWGQYLVHESDNGYVALDGTIDTHGSIRIDEHLPDGGSTGYYFQGTFSKEGMSGKYLSTQRTIDMDFYAN